MLVRYNRGSLPLYDAKGNPLDVPAKLARLRKPGRVREWAAYVHPADLDPIAGRLCAVRLPPDKAEEARRRLRKEHGGKVSKESLIAAGFVVVFTTAPQARLSKDRILELYGLRWQVELHIKRDKSIARLDKLPNFRPDTILDTNTIASARVTSSATASEGDTDPARANPTGWPSECRGTLAPAGWKPAAVPPRGVRPTPVSCGAPLSPVARDCRLLRRAVRTPGEGPLDSPWHGMCVRGGQPRRKRQSGIESGSVTWLPC